MTSVPDSVFSIAFLYNYAFPLSLESMLNKDHQIIPILTGYEPGRRFHRAATCILRLKRHSAHAHSSPSDIRTLRTSDIRTPDPSDIRTPDTSDMRTLHILTHALQTFRTYVLYTFQTYVLQTFRTYVLYTFQTYVLQTFRTYVLYTS